LLEARYTAQDFVVINEGKGGEKAADGYSRFFSAVNTHQPEVVLILDGYNDLGAGADGIPAAITAVSDMAKHARFRGARVFIATLSAPTPGVNRGLGDSVIRAYNDRLKDVTRGELAVLVDVYAATATNPALYNSDDNRHLSEAGYRKVAETFLAAIRASLEL
jgi:lysophospholipase L1-like esterase